MQDQERERVNANRELLCRKVGFQDLLPFLTQKEILTETQVEDIECRHEGNNVAQVNALLTALQQPSTTCEAFENFITSLIETGHREAADLIRPGVDVEAYGSNSTPPPSLADQPRLLVKKAVRVREGHECYKMTSRPRGFWVIINNYDFSSSIRYEDRMGSDKDAERMAQVAADLGFDVLSKNNLSGDEMYNFLEDISMKDALYEHDSIFVLIMSHGQNEMLVGIDGSEVHVHDLKALFYSNKCPALDRKPKVFIFVSCRGADIDGPMERSKSCDQTRNLDSSYDRNGLSVSSDGDDQGQRRRRSRRPSGRVVDDMLTAYSTSPGYVSHRHPEDGTYYIAALARVLMEKSCDEHLVKLLKTVDRELQEKVINDAYMQTPGFEMNGFNKKLYFNPGFFDDEASANGAGDPPERE